ncbi:GerAB/ArcD/ProY family transporter [Bacillus weihaiensis]|uniref:GerAB/ArcD/ProY family transporter n=1 Tax=Bacillus weihaiensis TaxID=1547283 RepID=UPI0013148B12|nr:endospore germination permease [Bacillus weihaiensis]
MKKEKVSASQFTILVILFVLGSSILYLPALVTSVADQDAIFSAIIASICGGLLAFFYAKFGTLFPTKSYIEVIKATVGVKIGFPFIFITFSYFVFLCAVLLWDIGDFMVTQILPGTPIQSIYILFLAVVVYVTRLGIETIARTGEIFLPWISLLFGALILLLLPEIDWTNIEPLFENGLKPVLYGSYHMIGFPFIEMFILLMFTPYIKNSQHLPKAFVIGLVIGSIVLTTLIAYCVLILGSGITTRQEYPIYVLGKKVSIGNFLERLEIIVAIMWIISIFFKLTLTFYGLCLGMAQFLNLQEYKTISFPLAIFIYVATLIFFPSSIYLKEYSQYASTPFIITVGFILPGIIYGIAKWKKRRRVVHD